VRACVKTFRAGFVEGSDATAPFTSKPRRHESVNPCLLSIPLSLPSSSSLSTSSVCSPCALRPRNFDVFFETDLSRLLPSFRDSLDTSWPLQYRSRGARWPAWNRRIRRLRLPFLFFYLLFTSYERASCRYVEFFMNTDDSFATRK